MHDKQRFQGPQRARRQRHRQDQRRDQDQAAGDPRRQRNPRPQQRHRQQGQQPPEEHHSADHDREGQLVKAQRHQRFRGLGMAATAAVLGNIDIGFQMHVGVEVRSERIEIEHADDRQQPEHQQRAHQHRGHKSREVTQQLHETVHDLALLAGFFGCDCDSENSISSALTRSLIAR